MGLAKYRDMEITTMWINIKEHDSEQNSFAILKHEGDLAITNDLFKRAILEHFDINEEFARIPLLSKEDIRKLENNMRIGVAVTIDDMPMIIDVAKLENNMRIGVAVTIDDMPMIIDDMPMIIDVAKTWEYW
jgi:hypothetical protein